MEIISTGLILQLLFLLVGFVLGKNYTGNKAIIRLRSRGYSLHVTRYSDGNVEWWWTRHAFDKELQNIKTQSDIFPNKQDAIANADVHYHATIVHNLDRS